MASVTVGSNLTIKLIFAASPLNTQHDGERAKTKTLARCQYNVPEWSDMSNVVYLGLLL